MPSSSPTTTSPTTSTTDDLHDQSRAGGPAGRFATALSRHSAGERRSGRPGRHGGQLSILTVHTKGVPFNGNGRPAARRATVSVNRAAKCERPSESAPAPTAPTTGGPARVETKTVSAGGSRPPRKTPWTTCRGREVPSQRHYLHDTTSDTTSEDRLPTTVDDAAARRCRHRQERLVPQRKVSMLEGQVDGIGQQGRRVPPNRRP